MIRRTERLNAFFLMYLSYHKMQDLQPCYQDGVYVLYHRLKQLRSISYPARYILSCMYLQQDAGNELGLLSYL